MGRKTHDVRHNNISNVFEMSKLPLNLYYKSHLSG